eukprot:239805_1
MSLWLSAWHLLCFCLLSHPLLCDESSTVLYVASNGTDASNVDCSPVLPCGTLYHALKLCDNITDVDVVEILVYGVNETDLLFLPRDRTLRTMTNFTITYKSDYPEWYPLEPISSTRIVINNLYYTNKHRVGTDRFLFVGDAYASTFMFYNCTFKDLRMDAYPFLIAARHLSIYDSVFSNISFHGDSSFVYFGLEWEASLLYVEKGDTLLLENTVFDDLYISSANVINAFSVIDVSVAMSTFSNIRLRGSILIYLEFNFLDSTLEEAHSNSELDVFDTNFMNVNGGSLIVFGYGGIAWVSNTNITSSDYSKDGKHLFDVHSTTRMTMTNIHLQYQMNDQLKDICYIDTDEQQYTERYQYNLCRYPIGLLKNAGFTAMNNIYITNDISASGLREYRDYAMQQLNLTTTDDGEDIISEFRWPYDSIYQDFPLPSLIQNSGGLLHVNNTTIDGIVHVIDFWNSGVLIMTGLNVSVPRFVFDNSDLIDPRWLVLEAWPYVVANQGSMVHGEVDLSCNEGVSEHCVLDDINADTTGILVIQDSFISGKGAVIDNLGHIGIYNTYIQNATHIASALDSLSVNIIGCHFKSMGYYHIGFVPMYWTVNDVSRSLFLSQVQSAVIKDNLFEYFSDHGYIVIKNMDAKYVTNVTIKRNRFINPVTIESFTLSHFQRIDQMEMTNLTMPDTDLDKVGWIAGIYGYDEYFHGHHMVDVEGAVQSSIIGNTFPQNDLYTTALDTACLSLIESHSPNCVSGNTFYGPALRVFQSTVTSCFFPELVIREEKRCWTETGAMDLGAFEDVNWYNTMVATDISVPIVTMRKSQIILDQTMMSTNFSHTNGQTSYNPFDLREGADLSVLNLKVLPSEPQIKIEFNQKCINLCTRLYTDLIHQLHIFCNNITNALNLVSLLPDKHEWEVTENDLQVVNHTLPSQLMLNSSESLYPGGTLDIGYSILDRYNHTIHDWKGEMFVMLRSVDFGFDTTMHINTALSQPCDMCKTGLYIQNVRMDMDDLSTHKYTIQATVKDNLLRVNDISFVISPCPAGNGLNTISSQCYACNVGEFSLSPSVSPCISCTSKPLEGVECLGKDELIVSQNYWVGIHHTKDYDIVSKHCPAHYCSQRKGSYLELQASNELCALNRDPLTPFCGRCKDGFSELFGSTNCGKCEANSYELWVIALVVSIIFGVVVVFSNAIMIHKKEKEARKMRRHCGMTLSARKYIKIALQKSILYHYQSLTFIFLNTSMAVHLMALAETFNFQLDFLYAMNDTDAHGYCWIKGLTAKTRIMLNLVIPTFSALTIMVMLIIYRCKRYAIFGKRVYFGKAFVNILLLVVGTICGICFKLIACRALGTEWTDDFVHFYFGVDKCYDTVWFTATVALAFMVTLFCFCFVKLFRDRRDPHTRPLLRDNKYVLESLVKAFKREQYWYWEIVMFSRRFIIAMLNALGDIKNANDALFVLLIIYLMAQFACNPFRIKEVNRLEIVCLLCLLSTLHILSNNTNSAAEHNIFPLLLLNGLIALPFIVFVIHAVQINCREKNGGEIDDNSDSEENKDQLPNGAIELGPNISYDEHNYTNARSSYAMY